MFGKLYGRRTAKARSSEMTARETTDILENATKNVENE